MKIIDLPLAELLAADVEYLDALQGSDEWMAWRARRFGASDAPAMLGLSKNETRNELLHRLHTGIQKEFSPFVQDRVIDHGHAVEAAIRAHIEEILGEELSPVTCGRRGTKLSASADGLTMGREIGWENKQWAQALADEVSAGRVPDSHMPQCQQVLLVTGASKLLFSVTDGTPAGTVWCWVHPDQAWFDRILRGWSQLERDLQDYVPQPAAPAVSAAPLEHLPAVSVQVSGALAVASNLADFGVRLKAFIARMPANPSTDQEFVDTEAACKRLREAQAAIERAVDGALASIADVNELRRIGGEMAEAARAAALAGEKVVKSRKDELRAAEVERGRSSLAAYVAELDAELGGRYMPPPLVDFGLAIKGLKTLESIRNAIDTTLAQAKIAASTMSGRIAENLKTIDAAGPESKALFADRAALVLKDPEAVAAIVSGRLAEHKSAEERKLDAARADERAKAAAAATPAPPAAPTASPAPVQTAAQPAAPTDGPARRLADINAALGWTMTAAQVEALGIKTIRKNVTVLVPASEIPALKRAMAARVEAL